MVRQSDTPASIDFGHFSIFPHRRELLADGRPITLGGRAFDVLLALIEASGAVVSGQLAPGAVSARRWSLRLCW